MKFKNVPGELAFKALVKHFGSEYSWQLSDGYFFTKKDALDAGHQQIIWPVEVWEDGSVYIPSQEELE